jgi:hypothetical protein
MKFWQVLSSISSGAGLLADWRYAFGAEFELVWRFLIPTTTQATSHPCTSDPPCECRHVVRETDWGSVGVCSCGPGECETIRLEPKDLLVYTLDWKVLGSAICRVLGFSEIQEPVYPAVWIHAIGIHEPTGAAVYVTLAKDEILLGEVEKLILSREAPFILLTPTPTSCTPEAKAVLNRNRCAQLSLATLLTPEIGGSFRLEQPIGPLLESFKMCLPGGKIEILNRIEEEIVAVRTHLRELPATTLCASVASASCDASPPRTPAFAIRKGLGLWKVTFESHEAEFKHQQGATYVTWLLLNPHPIHALDLLARLASRDRANRGFTELTDPATGKTVPLEAHSRIQERSLGLEHVQTLRALRLKEQELEAIIEDENESEPVKAEAMRDLEAITQFQKQSLHRTADSAQKAAKSVRVAISRFHQHLRTSTDATGNPHAVLRSFATHIEKHLIIPSARYASRGAGHGRTGLAGHFTYEPPSGLIWTG